MFQSDPSLSSLGTEVKPSDDNHAPTKVPPPRADSPPAPAPEQAPDHAAGLEEELLDSLVTEVLSSDERAPSVPFVVLDVMQEEFEATPPTPTVPEPAVSVPAEPAQPTLPEAPGAETEPNVLTTDIDTIVVNDNRTKPEVATAGERCVTALSHVSLPPFCLIEVEKV